MGDGPLVSTYVLADHMAHIPYLLSNLLSRDIALPDEEFGIILSTCKLNDAAEMVRSTIASLPHAIQETKFPLLLNNECHLVHKLCTIIGKVLTFPDGTKHAIDLCVHLLSTSVLYGCGDKRLNRTEAEIRSFQYVQELNELLLVLLDFAVLGKPQTLSGLPRVHGFTATELCRRIQEGARAHGCGLIPKVVDYPYEQIFAGDCTCLRRSSLKALQAVQKLAYGEVRSKIFLTIGTLLPADLCMLIFEHSMAVEYCPLDSRVHVGDRQKEPNIWIRSRAQQSMFRIEYRCPRFKTTEGVQDGLPAETNAMLLDRYNRSARKILEACRSSYLATRARNREEVSSLSEPWRLDIPSS